MRNRSQVVLFFDRTDVCAEVNVVVGILEADAQVRFKGDLLRNVSDTVLVFTASRFDADLFHESLQGLEWEYPDKVCFVWREDGSLEGYKVKAMEFEE